MGRSRNETNHRILASHLLFNLQRWGYFKPHVSLINETPEMRDFSTD